MVYNQNKKFYSIVKYYILFCIGFCTYSIIEVLFRGYTFFTMGLTGGIAFLIIDQINNKISWDLDILLQGILGSTVVTLLELIIGTYCIYNNLPSMWDYSSMPLNYHGVICLPFSIAWIFISIFGILVADLINYYIFGEEPCPYYNLLGRKVFKYPERKKN